MSKNQKGCFVLKDEQPFRTGDWLSRQVQKVGSGNSKPVGHISIVGVLSFGLHSVQKSEIFRYSLS